MLKAALFKHKGESPMKQIIVSITILMLVCCGEVDANNESGNYSQYNQPTEDIVTIHLDDLTFEEAFSIEYRAKGQGDTFWWRGTEYTTDLAESTPNTGVAWVLNNDDPDDDCYYNKRDECGVCNGDGKTTWWRDKDGDGLGDHKEFIVTCYDPNVEDLREYSGDMGALK